MISPTFRTKTKGMKLEVVDRDGNAELFSSVKEVSATLKCSVSYVY